MKASVRLDVSSQGNTIVEVNQRFTDKFGHTAESILDVMSWSGGGFLPWGGDFLALILEREEDLLVFLQILALKVCICIRL